jgi:PIN domain nuclease of toxin-antitoxin system
MNKVILDASALLALIKNESGADKVEPLLGFIVMSSVNVSEAAAILLGSEMSSQEVQDCLLPLISVIVPFDEEQAFQAADLKKKPKRQGLSLGDRACIALGIKMQFPIYTADRIWQEVQLDTVEIKLIRP